MNVDGVDDAAKQARPRAFGYSEVKTDVVLRREVCKAAAGQEPTSSSVEE